MKEPNGTFMKRLLSINHTEQTGCWACAAGPNRLASAAIPAVTANERILDANRLIAFLPLQPDDFLSEIGFRLSFPFDCLLKHDPDPKGRVSAKCEAVFRTDRAQT